MNTFLINIFLFALLGQGVLDAKVQSSPNVSQPNMNEETHRKEEVHQELLQKTSLEEVDLESECNVEESRSSLIVSKISRFFAFVMEKLFRKKTISEDTLNDQTSEEVSLVQSSPDNEKGEEVVMPMPPPLPPRPDNTKEVNGNTPKASSPPPLPPRPSSKNELLERIREGSEALRKTRKELQKTEEPTSEVTSVLGNEAMIQRVKKSSNQADDSSDSEGWDDEDQDIPFLLDPVGSSAANTEVESKIQDGSVASRQEERTRADTHDFREKIEARRVAIAGNEFQESDDSFWD